MARAIKRGEDALKAAQEPEEDIADYLEDDLAKKLLDQAKTNEDAAWIAAHPSAYDVDGWAIQYKILKLAAEEPLAIDYVRQWPDKYPQYDQVTSTKNTLPTKQTGPQNIPQLFQFDQRWGYTVYSSTAFGMTGCCPTALAMVYQGLTGNTDLTPYDMGVLAETDGYMSSYEGTDAYFVLNEAEGLGLYCEEIYPSSESIIASLENNRVLIVNVGEGDFTNGGHFIVVTGIQDDQLIVNDPYSKVRSDKLWDINAIAEQAITMFALSKA